MDPRPMEGPLKSLLPVCLSICPSVSLAFFLKNGPLLFSDCLHNGRWLEYLKSDRALFSRKIYFCPKLVKKGPEWSQNNFFYFLNIFVISFSWNNLKWMLILLLIFHHKSHFWQKSGSWVIGQSGVSQWNCRILQNIISQKKKVNNEVYFWHADKHQSFLQVGSIILGVRNQACPNYPKNVYLWNISRKMWPMKLIFSLQINTEVFYKLVVSLWVCVARHAQST